MFGWLSSPWARVEVGPDLPMPIYTCTEPWNPTRIGGLALYCSDGRWGDACDEFCHHCLQLPRYDRYALPGGPAWLVPRDEGAELSRAAWEQLEFLVRIHELGRIVLIGHYGCAYYGEMLQVGPEECLPAQFKDLEIATHSLREWFPAIKVAAYFGMRKGKSISFHQVGV